MPPGCKRIPKSPDYYAAVQLPNVACVSAASTESRPAASRTDGTVDHYDVIVVRHRLRHPRLRAPDARVGPDGVTLDEMWGESDVFSYRGVAVPKLPNFFVLNGPFSPVNNVTIPATLADEMGWVCEVLAAGVDEESAIVPSEQTTEEFVSWLAEAIPQTVWADGCVNWYQSARVPRDLALVRQGTDRDVPRPASRPPRPRAVAPGCGGHD